jgi:hypothetical protein
MLADQSAFFLGRHSPFRNKDLFPPQETAAIVRFAKAARSL